MFYNIKNIQRKMEKVSEDLSKLNKQLSLFDENSSNFSDKMELNDLDKIDKDYIIQMIPDLIKSETAFGKVSKKIEKINPTICNDIDFI